MSVFASDDRILLEEIVESEEQELSAGVGGAGGSGVVSTLDEEEEEEEEEENPVSTSTSLADISETAQDHYQQQQTHHQPHHHHHHHQSSHQKSRRIIAGHSNSASNNVVGRVTPRSSHMEQEKRMRREIANSNERRRMQSINAGFQSLRTLLPHHEGEKLSKAAILQQTAEYIYQLEQEKTQLLSQNCQLKRLVNQHEGGDVPIKKRKPDTQGVVVSLPMHVSESGDEGLGSMSPEPLSVITVTTESHSVVNSELVDLRRQLERERHARLHLEKQLRAIQSQLYPERFRDNQLIAYQPHEVIEHTDNVMAQETEDAVAGLQVVSVVSLPPVGSTQTVETSNPDPASPPPLSPEPATTTVVAPSGAPNEMATDEIKESGSRSNSPTPKIVTFASGQVFSTIEDQTTDSFGTSRSSRVSYGSSGAQEFKNVSPQYITASPSRPFSPSPPEQTQRLPSVLEAAMKAEPKVEVERLPSPASSLDDGTPQARLYLANTSRQNLETIVEAIRHLEGDHLFSDEPAQEVPLALTNKPTSPLTKSTPNGSTTTAKQRLLHAEVNNFLQFHSQQQTQQRPGVIVVKHS